MIPTDDLLNALYLHFLAQHNVAVKTFVKVPSMIIRQYFFFGMKRDITMFYHRYIPLLVVGPVVNWTLCVSSTRSYSIVNAQTLSCTICIR